MPYYLHTRDAAPESGVAYDDKAAAVAARAGDTCLTFVPSEDESWNWKRRERNRFNDGTYTRLPFRTHGDHYAHHALGDPGKIAYTASETHGHEDRQTVVTAGRYLERFGVSKMGVAADEWPSMIAAVKMIGAPIQVATTADEIGRVYCAPGSPMSCMGRGHGWDWRDAPTRVYAGGDLAVAYIGTLDADDDTDKDRIAARAVVWPERKSWVRAYGDTAVMEAALKAAGYEREHDFAGARVTLQRARHDDAYVMPYIDGDAQQADIVGRYFVLRASGDYECNDTNGLTRDACRNTCANCSEECGEDETYCDGCADEHWSCESCGAASFDSYDAHRTEDGLTLCESCHSDQHHVCQVCDDGFDMLDMSRNDRRTHNTDLCPGCVETHAWCDDCESYAEGAHARQSSRDEAVESCDECRATRDAEREAARRVPARPRGTILRRHSAVVPYMLTPTTTEVPAHAR
jgi:hypothetical protein